MLILVNASLLAALSPQKVHILLRLDMQTVSDYKKQRYSAWILVSKKLFFSIFPAENNFVNTIILFIRIGVVGKKWRPLYHL
jgi:hypothetical protein